ncbi:MAG: (Fe-S)-binding protein [Desulfobacteraceae bacterium]|nr:(Fe-S)-binding protein [Desulfobacteraceae bacterium]
MNTPIKPLQNCGKCGLCLGVCPVYRELKEEQASPRARLQLIKAFENNILESSPLLKQIISKCLMCGSCAIACPAGINHYEKFMDMRQKMVADLGENKEIKSLIFLLSKESRIRRGAGLIKLAQKLTPGWLANKYCMGNIPLKRFPELNPTPLRKKMAETIQPRGIKKGSLVYFTGCATNYIYEDTGLSMVGTLTHLGFEVIIPEDQTCCAIPLMFHGAQNLAVKNIITNIEALTTHKCDGILVDCATCGTALKNEYPALLKKIIATDPLETHQPWKRLAVKAEQIAKKTMDILSFIAAHRQELVFDKTTPNMGQMAYHAPCHSRNSFNLLPLVQNLLKELPFMEYSPDLDEATCCGGGGTFFYEHPEIAKKIMDKKLFHLKSIKANYWLTDCPVCRINLSGNLDESENIQVIHPITLIHRALKNSS